MIIQMKRVHHVRYESILLYYLLSSMEDFQDCYGRVYAFDLIFSESVNALT